MKGGLLAFIPDKLLGLWHVEQPPLHALLQPHPAERAVVLVAHFLGGWVGRVGWLFKPGLAVERVAGLRLLPGGGYSMS